MNVSTPSTMSQWVAGGNGEAIWASGGLASDGTGVFATTGNRTPFGQTPSDPHLDSEEVVRVTGMGTRADYFYPTEWKTMDRDDLDFGSVNPVYITVPGATPSNLVAAISKNGLLFLLDAQSLRGATADRRAGRRRGPP